VYSLVRAVPVDADRRRDLILRSPPRQWGRG
jgi:hypothetical protein